MAAVKKGEDKARSARSLFWVPQQGTFPSVASWQSKAGRLAYGKAGRLAYGKAGRLAYGKPHKVFACPPDTMADIRLRRTAKLSVEAPPPVASKPPLCKGRWHGLP